MPYTPNIRNWNSLQNPDPENPPTCVICATSFLGLLQPYYL